MRIYGNENESFVVTEKGEIYIIQSVNFTDEGQYEKIDQLPLDAELLDRSLTPELEIPVELWDDHEVVESANSLYDGGWRSTDKHDLMKEYNLSNSGADRIIECLEKLEEQ